MTKLSRSLYGSGAIPHWVGRDGKLGEMSIYLGGLANGQAMEVLHGR